MTQHTTPATDRPGYPGDDIAEVDLLDATTHATYDLGPLWRRLRAGEPLRWYPPRATRPGFWLVTRYAVALDVLRSGDRFTSRHGNMLGTLLRGGDAGGGKMLVVTDGRRHSGLRQLMAAGFAPRMLEVASASVRAATARLLDATITRGGGEFVADVASVIPLTAICELLGVPEKDRSRVLDLTGTAMLAGDDGPAGIESRIAQSEILLYYAKLAAERRRAPGGDIVSMLATAEVDGRRLTDHEVLLNCYNLIIGGDETAQFAISGTVYALARHPDAWATLRADPDLVDTATEEFLRWTTPALHVARTTVADTTLHGTEIRAGDLVTIWNESVNRDASMFTDPDALDVTRSPNRHLTFGYGAHFCLGAYLARVELRTVIRALLRVVESIDVIGPVARRPSTFISGISRLPVAFTRAGTASPV